MAVTHALSLRYYYYDSRLCLLAAFPSSLLLFLCFMSLQAIDAFSAFQFFDNCCVHLTKAPQKNYTT